MFGFLFIFSFFKYIGVTFIFEGGKNIMNKNTITYIGIAAVVMALLGLNPMVGGIGLIAIALGIVGLELLGILKNIPVLQTLSGRTPKGTLAVLFVAGLIFGGFLGSISMGNVTEKLPQATVGNNLLANEQQNTNVPSSETLSAQFNFYPAGNQSGTYAGTGVVYVLDSASIPDRYTFMQKIADGKTAELMYRGAPASSISVSSGTFTKNGMSAELNKPFEVCGYEDSSPALGESIAFCKEAKVTGITGGSVPQYMWKFTETGGSDYQWYNYANLTFADTNEVARLSYKETQASPVDKSFSFDVIPNANGEKWQDAALYIETPSSSAGMFKSIEITLDGKTVTYTSLQNTGQMSSSMPEFIAAPTLITGTDNMYYVGKFPAEPVRTSASQKAVATVKVTYSHPASSDVLSYFRVVQNADAKTISGGHFDTTQTNLTLNLTTSGSSGWT